MKLAFYGLLVAGFIGCTTLGIGKTLERVGGDWTAWPMVAGIALGVAIIALAAAFATGFRPSYLATDRAYIVALAALIGSKVVVSLASMATAGALRG